MRDPNFTPGPYAYDECRAIHSTHPDHDGAPIASLREDEGATDEQIEANGYLLAAAPSLLAACMLWDEGFDDGEEFDDRQFLKWVNRNRAAARVAIAKARGEQ